MTFQHDYIFWKDFSPSVFISARGDVLSNVHMGLAQSSLGGELGTEHHYSSMSCVFLFHITNLGLPMWH